MLIAYTVIHLESAADAVQEAFVICGKGMM